MAFSSRSRLLKRQVRSDFSAFRVTKSSKLEAQPQASKQKIDAIEAVIAEKDKAEQQRQKQNLGSKKRRRDEVDSDTENEEGANRPQKSSRRAPPTSIPTPPASSPEPDVLPKTLDDLRSLHKSFVQALALHYAHQGTRSAVALSELTPAMTRLWKKRSVSQQDVERILAVWELESSTESPVEHKKGPFKLVTFGIGPNQQTKIEYAWPTSSGTFIESELHKQYESLITRLIQLPQIHATLKTYTSLTSFPRLECTIGTQTQARQDKVSTIRSTILSKPSPAPAEPDFSTLTICDASETSRKEKTLKSRTLGLFDRLRAKQLANSSISSTPSSTDLRRRRALHRIPDLIPLLRLKQSQKLNALFRSDLHGIPSATRSAKMKVSFGLEQLVQEVRDSGQVPIVAEEIREGICILGREVPDTWCSVYLGEGIKCVTLQGEGWKLDQVREWCEREMGRIGG